MSQLLSNRKMFVWPLENRLITIQYRQPEFLFFFICLCLISITHHRALQKSQVLQVICHLFRKVGKWLILFLFMSMLGIFLFLSPEKEVLNFSNNILKHNILAIKFCCSDKCTFPIPSSTTRALDAYRKKRSIPNDPQSHKQMTLSVSMNPQQIHSLPICGLLTWAWNINPPTLVTLRPRTLY